MSVQDGIESKIRTALDPTHLEVVNESHMHSVPPGSESHFRLVVVSDRFERESRISRHQSINRLLADELATGVHALSMQILTTAEWRQREGRTFTSPDCHGGGNVVDSDTNLP